MKVAEIERSMTPAISIKSGVQIKKYQKEHLSTSWKLIGLLIANTAAFYNVNGQISEQQIVMTTQAITDRYEHENIEDIIICLKNGRAGHYGKLYGKFDGEVIMDWMQKYMETKAEVLEKMHHNNKHQAIDIAPEVMEVAKKFIESRNPQPVADAGSREAWVIDIVRNIDTMTGEQLRRLRTDLENDNIHGGNADLIALIDSHLQIIKLKKVKKLGSNDF